MASEMEDELQKSSRPRYPADSPDAKYLSGLSTILFRTIQEAKDRISQIEYVCCNQLLPNIHLKTQSLQKIYSDARVGAENSYKEKEKNLLLQIKKLQCEKQQVMEEKAVELNEWRQAHKNLQKLLDSKDSLILRHENTIKEVQEKEKIILKKQLFLEAETEKLELELVKKSEKVDDLLSGFREKKREEENAKDLREHLRKKIEYQASKMMDSELVVNKYVKENSFLTSKVGSLVNCVDELKKELSRKNNDLEEEKKVHQQLLLQIDSFNFERAKRGTELEGFENEKRLLLDEQKVLEETIDIISEKSKEPSIGMELLGKLLQQFEAKDSELLSEKRKPQELITRSKKLKSQYIYACKNLDLTPETMLSHHKIEYDSEIFRHGQSPATSRVSDIENKAAKAVDSTSEVTIPKQEQELLPDNKETLLIERTNPASSSITRAAVSPKWAIGKKSCTRSHQSHLGSDPHDDFLDTPLENVKEIRGKVIKEEIHND